MKRIPRAAPQSWHEKSIADWNAHAERCKIGRAERRKIREKYERRIEKREVESIG